MKKFKIVMAASGHSVREVYDWEAAADQARIFLSQPKDDHQYQGVLAYGDGGIFEYDSESKGWKDIAAKYPGAYDEDYAKAYARNYAKWVAKYLAKDLMDDVSEAYADRYAENYAASFVLGKAIGYLEFWVKCSKLYSMMKEDGRSDEVIATFSDPDRCSQALVEYGIEEPTVFDAAKTKTSLEEKMEKYLMGLESPDAKQELAKAQEKLAETIRERARARIAAVEAEAENKVAVADLRRLINGLEGAETSEG